MIQVENVYREQTSVIDLNLFLLDVYIGPYLKQVLQKLSVLSDCELATSALAVHPLGLQAGKKIE